MEVQSHTALATTLFQMVESGRIPHAMLLHENDGGGAFPLLLSFLDRLYARSPRVEKLIHPDIHFVFPVAGSDKPVSDQFLQPWRTLLLENPYFFENELYAAIGIEGKQSSISVHEARLLLEKLSLSAVEGGYRTVVMYLPEKMNLQAGNTLLKMVEEPPEKTLFLLVTHSPEKVLVTIASRCLFLRVPPLTREEDRRVHPAAQEGLSGYTDLFADLMDALLRKDLLAALETGEALSALESREKQKAFCRHASTLVRDVFLVQQGLASLQDLSEEERPVVEGWAAKVRKTFPRQAASALDRAVMLLERNVSQKILFTDLVNRLYMNV